MFISGGVETFHAIYRINVNSIIVSLSELALSTASIMQEIIGILTFMVILEILGFILFSFLFLLLSHACI